MQNSRSLKEAFDLIRLRFKNNLAIWEILTVKVPYLILFKIYVVHDDTVSNE